MMRKNAVNFILMVGRGFFFIVDALFYKINFMVNEEMFRFVSSVL